jgi:plastocyanin
MDRGKAGACAAVSVVAVAVAVTGAGAAASGPGAQSAKPKVRHTTRNLKADPNGNLKFDKKKLSSRKGKVTLVMKDPASSGLAHGIGVRGHGVDKNGKTVAPGKTSRVTVTLNKTGKYTFYCPVDGHEQAGMKGTLTITK